MLNQIWTLNEEMDYSEWYGTVRAQVTVVVQEGTNEAELYGQGGGGGVSLVVRG